jgi:3-oxoacyl-[acyl-carrier protein] reductase
MDCRYGRRLDVSIPLNACEENVQIDLSGKIAIVTGGGRGIGREIARTLAAEGVVTVIADIRSDLLDDVRAEWRDKGWDGAQLACDVRDAAQCRAAVAETLARYGRIDILVNNAGVAGGGPIDKLSEETWDANLDTNLKGVFLMSQAVVPAMKAQQGGRIISASSFAAIVPAMGSAAYAASKAGVESITRVLAGELGAFGVTVNCYAPGMIPTEMNHYAERTDGQKLVLLDTLTIRRWGSPQDIANLVCFLSSDLASYITGTMIDISGGKFATQQPWAAYRAER